MAGKQIYEFGVFRLDPGERQLLRRGQPVPLAPKAFEVLLALVENGGHLVSKEDLMKRVWPDAFVEEANLPQNISAIRRALRDGNGSGQYIETIPKGGYRFVAPVSVARDGPAAPQAVAPAARPTRTALSGQKFWRLAVVALAIAIAGTVLYFMARRPAAHPSASAGKIMLAVLPFENYGPDAERDYLADGLTEEMITQLGSLNPRKLGVIARTSAMKYKRARVGIDQIGRELDVDYVLEGSIRTEGDRVRVAAQLIRVKDQTHLWARSYERTHGGMLIMQDEVAKAIANEIQVELTPQYQQRLVTRQFADARAHEAYARGRFFWNKRTDADLATAIGYFEDVLRYEPLYALAYSGLADAYFYRSYAWGSLQPRDGMLKAKAAATKALELDSDLAEGHTSMALVKLFYDWDWAGAEAEFKRAIELNPNYPTAHHGYAVLLMIVYGRMDDAIAEANRALELDPLSVPLNNIVASILLHAAHFDETIERARKLHELNPSMPDAYRYMSAAFEGKGSFNDAVEASMQAHVLEGANEQDLAQLRQAYASAGIAGYHEAEAQTTIRRAKQKVPQTVLARLAVATAYAQLNENSAALDVLEKICDERSGMAVWTKIEYSHFHGMRSDPRFDALLKHTGLPQ
jgi:TolB-like protein/DNA-binding winged helix-turn-helix (wHTH) protein